MSDFTRVPFGLTRRRALTLGAASAGALLTGIPALAQTRLSVTEGNVAPVPIAIPDFLGGTPGDADAARGISGVITNNLRRSGLFAPIDPAAYIERIANFDALPRFPDWKTINAQALVTGRVTRQPDGRLKVEFRLWDVSSGQQLTGQQYFTSPDNWRRIAHIVSDSVYERLTGEKGYFDTRIVFIDETGPKERRVKRLSIMDQDGANVRYLTRGEDLVLTPRFSPTGQQVIMSLQQGANSNLFVMDLQSKRTTRLTDTAAIDTAPCYAPDGGRICFESDRGGKPQIYVMAAGGGGAQRISFGPGSYSTPVWSPRGDFIAFTKQGGGEGGQFSIGIMRPDGKDERLLTTGYHNEGPTFAPNGRVLMFFRDLGQGPSLYTIDVTGRNEQKVQTPSYASDPAWSPLLS